MGKSAGTSVHSSDEDAANVAFFHFMLRNIKQRFILYGTRLYLNTFLLLKFIICYSLFKYQSWVRFIQASIFRHSLILKYREKKNDRNTGLKRDSLMRYLWLFYDFIL
jgi:hypothetical protein